MKLKLFKGNGPAISRFQNFAVVSGVLGGVGIVVMVIHQLTIRYKLASLSEKVNKFLAVLSPLLLLLSGKTFVLVMKTRFKLVFSLCVKLGVARF